MHLRFSDKNILASRDFHFGCAIFFIFVLCFLLRKILFRNPFLFVRFSVNDPVDLFDIHLDLLKMDNIGERLSQMLGNLDILGQNQVPQSEPLEQKQVRFVEK